ncbi:unnamed protein product, partial [Musa acuminata var. zebrina]
QHGLRDHRLRPLRRHLPPLGISHDGFGERGDESVTVASFIERVGGEFGLGVRVCRGDRQPF